MDVITQALGDDYAMFYHPSINTTDLIAVETLDQCIMLVNEHMIKHGPDIGQWSEGWRNKAAKLVRVNWIYQRLAQEPIRKPILAHPTDQGLLVDCGDTRLMSLDLLDQPSQVSVVITCNLAQATKFSGWRQILTCDQLRAAAGFDSGAHVMVSPASAGEDHAISWLEIGDASTAHHLHDQTLRERMIESYLKTQRTDFRFSRQWARQAIDWQDLLAKDQNL